MIRAEDMRDHLAKKPFEPFRIVMTDGKVYDVTHPELCLLSRATVYVGRPSPRRSGIAAGVDHCALIHVVRFEPINGSRRRTTRKRK